MSETRKFLARQDSDLRSILQGFLEQIDEWDPKLEVTWRRSGFEVRIAADKNNPAGRPRLFVFNEGADKVFAFFYKPSRLSFSKDRFAYGLLALHRGTSDMVIDSLTAGLVYLAHDFKPSHRPEKLGRTIHVTIPRD